ncbi:MAG: hypothetical protein KJ077_24735 [Anaerolineae bacterium]|nr:hypothetical protein [Anaerolineae bacterium]
MPADTVQSSTRTPNESSYPRRPQCDNYHPGPGGRLNRCRHRACYQFTILDCGYTAVLFRCQTCREELYADIKRDSVFEVLDEASVGIPADPL